MSSYPHRSERLARAFAIHAINLKEQNRTAYRRLAERYRKASLYLYSRINRV